MYEKEMALVGPWKESERSFANGFSDWERHYVIQLTEPDVVKHGLMEECRWLVQIIQNHDVYVLFWESYRLNGGCDCGLESFSKKKFSLKNVQDVADDKIREMGYVLLEHEGLTAML